MANPANRSILLDHQMIVDGVLMRERKDLVKTLNDETGVEESHLTHTRFIGDKTFTAKKSITDGEEEEETIETEMDDSELENFNNEWEEKWSKAHILELLDATTKKNGPQNPSDDFLSYGNKYLHFELARLIET